MSGPAVRRLEMLDPRQVSRRRLRVAAIVLALTAPAVVTMADLHARVGYDG